MSFSNRIRSMYQWYRALRSLQRIMATMTVLMVLVSACGDDDPTGVGDARAKVTVVNGTDHSVWYVFTRACETATWGNDLLGSTIIHVGETKTFSVVPGCKDLRVETDPALAGTHQWDAMDLLPAGTDTLMLTEWTYEQ
jgi:hypothetical protein